MLNGVASSERNSLPLVDLAVAIVLGLALINLLFNLAATVFGAGYPFTSFLFRPSDRFADFFKLTFSYPGGPVHPAAHFWHLDGLLAHHWCDVKRFEGTDVNHFHVPPLETLLGLLFRALVQWVDPVTLFLLFLVSSLTALFATVLRLSPGGRTGAGLATVALLSYPTALIIDRGHFFSLICGMLLIAATLRTLRDKNCDAWSLVMFAVVLNIRPNAGVIPCVLLLGKRGISFRQAIFLGLSSLALFEACLWTAHAIYPAYSLDSFLKGLRDYGNVYVVGLSGFPTGSSLYGMLRALFPFAPWMYAPPVLVAGLIAASAILESRQDRLRQSECLFLVLAAYTLGSHIFADYHLIAFVVPLVLLAREGAPRDTSGWAILLASSLVLAPKNFMFVIHGNTAWSWQIVANPVILMIASVAVLGSAYRRQASEAAAELIPAVA